MKRFAPYFGAVYLVCLAAYIRYRTGTDYRLDILVALIGPYAVLSVFLPLYERYVRGQVDASAPRDVAGLRRSDPEFDAFMEDRPRVDERADWHWQAADAAAGLAFAFYPPLAHTVWRYRELRTETPFDGAALALMLLGGVCYVLWRRRRIRSYRCPGCGGQPARLAGERLRYACAACGWTWRLGQSVIGNGSAKSPAT